MTSLISASTLTTGQVQTLDSVRAHALPSDAMIFASATEIAPANQNTGSYAIVESGVNSLGVTATGSVPVVTQSPFADLYKEGSIYLNGTAGNYLQNTATYSNTTIQWNTTGMTVEAWVNYPTFAGASYPYPVPLHPIPTLFGKMTPTAGPDWSFGANTAGYVNFYYYSGTLQTVMSTTQLSTNTWNHIAMTSTASGKIYLFVNGVQTQVVAKRNGTLQAAALYETVQGTPTFFASPTLTIGQYLGANTNAYVANLRLTTGTPIYTGADTYYNTYTVPSAPLSSILTPGVTQFLLRAGQNSPTIQNGALTFDRGLKQFMNFGPQTFNVATQGFSAIFKFTLAGGAANYERLWQFGDATRSFGFLRVGTSTNWYSFYAGADGETATAGFTIPPNTISIVAVNYNPSVGTNGTWSTWLNGVKRSSVAMGARIPSDFVSPLTKIGDIADPKTFTANTFAFYNRSLSDSEIYQSYLALSTPAPLKTLEIGDINGTPALSIAGDGRVSIQAIGQTSAVTAWPPAPMTGYDTVINGGVYKARASSAPFGGNPGWYAFWTGAGSWVSASTYSTTAPPYNYTGTVSTVDVNGTSYLGEWFQIQLPIPIVPTSASGLVSGTAGPTYLSTLGSNDGVNWFLVNTQYGLDPSGGSVSFSISATRSYSYFRWVANRIAANIGWLQINGTWKVYGTADTAQPLTIAQPTKFTYPVQTPALTGIQNDGVYVPQDFSSSALNIPAYVVSNTATTANTVAYSGMGPFANEGSLYFPEGTGAYVNFGASTPQFSYDWTTADFTIEGYFFPINATHPGDYRIFGKDANQLLYIHSINRTWQYYIAGLTTPANGLFVGPAVTYNAWSHVAVSWVASTRILTLSVNGSITTFPAAVGTATYTPTAIVGFAQWVGNTGQYAGHLANFRFVRGAALYTAAFTPPTGPLQPVQGVTQAGAPYGTVLLLRNAPAPGRVLTQKFAGANSGSVLAFPPGAMTGYATTLNAGYGQGTYVASASTEYSGLYSWQAFDKSSSTLWASFSSLYNSSGVYTSTFRTVDVNGTSYSGEWVQIKVPSSIVLSSYSILNYNDAQKGPAAWYVLGSRDGTNWSLVDQRSSIPYSSSLLSYSVTSSHAFSYFRIVISNITGTGTLVQFAEWTLNGTIESVNITPDGRVGLGVVNPTRALEVAGDIVCSGTVSGGAGMGAFRNCIINGDMRINQRGISTTVGSPTTIQAPWYTLDRWCIFRPGYVVNFTVAQGTLSSTDLPYIKDGLYNFMRIGRTVGDTNTVAIAAIQAMETRESYHFAGGPVNLSFYYRTGTAWAGAGVGAVIYGSGTDQTPTNWGGSTISGAPALTASPNWTKITVAINIPINATQTGAYFTYTPTTNPAVVNDYIDITGVQLEKGTVATPFEFRPFATELALCQRYYSNVSIPSSHTIAVATAGNTNCQIVLPIPVPLRSTPAIATTGAFSFRGANADNIITAFTINSTSQNLVNMTGALTTTAGNGVVGGVMAFNTNVTIALSSEL